MTGWQIHVLVALPIKPPGLSLDEIEGKVSGMRHLILGTLKSFKRKGVVVRVRRKGRETWWRKIES